MSHYADYIRERTNDFILETPEGFATYRFMNEKSVYIIDIYVIPELRKSKIASKLADQIGIIAKERGCTEMFGSVVPSAKGSDSSIRVLQAYGMRVYNASNDFIVFKKDII